MITHELEESEKNVSLTVIPEIEAEYIGGYEKMIAYLKENCNDKIALVSGKVTQPLVVSFLIDKKGKAGKVKFIKKSENIEVNNLLIDLIENMPKWNVAKNFEGESVSQQFSFRVGGMDGC